MDCAQRPPTNAEEKRDKQKACGKKNRATQTNQSNKRKDWSNRKKIVNNVHNGADKKGAGKHHTTVHPALFLCKGDAPKHTAHACARVHINDMASTTFVATAPYGFPTAPTHRRRHMARIGLAARAHVLTCIALGVALGSVLLCAGPLMCLVASLVLAAIAARLHDEMRRETAALVSCGYDVGSAIRCALERCAPKAAVMFDVGDVVTRAACTERDPTDQSQIDVHLFVMETAHGAQAVYDRQQVAHIWPGLLVRSDRADPLEALFSPTIVPGPEGRVCVTVHRANSPVDRHKPFMTDAGRMGVAVERLRLDRREPTRDQQPAPAIAADPATPCR